MPHGPDEPTDRRPPPLSPIGTLLRLAVIGAIMVVVAGSFAFAGGWLTPGALTPASLIDTFEQVGGVHPGFRRNHAKGVCIAGTFESNGSGARLSKALVFTQGSVPVLGRFSFAGSQPDVADAPTLVRAMALRFALPDGEEWRTAMVDIPVFIVNTIEGFYEQLAAGVPDPATGKPDPAKMAAFVAHHPEFTRAIEIVKTRAPSSGFDNTTFYGLNAFRFVNEAGTATPVRWSVVPLQPFAAAAPVPPGEPDKNYLFDAVIARVAQQKLQWHLVVTVGQAGDPTNDPTVPWPEGRERVDVGTITIDRVADEETGGCRDITFDPLVLPSGIEPSDDPLLSARSAAYSQSLIRRDGEAKTPSAVSTGGKSEGTGS
jgi:catalase